MSPTPKFVLCRYPYATNKEDDIAIINKTLAFIPDDAGDSFAQARALTLSQPFQGLLSFGSDVDMFTFQGTGGRQVLVTFSLVDDYSPSDVALFYQRSDLDADVALLNSTGGVIQTWTNEFYGVFSGFGITSLPYTVGHG